METWVTIAEALEHSQYSHEHIALLLRQKKIQGRKSGNIWLVNLQALIEYERKMQELGSKKHSPR